MAVVAADVRKILEVPADVTDGQLASFITTAQLICDEDLFGKGLSAARLFQICLYLAAHFAVMLVERGGLTVSRIRDTEDNYVATPYFGKQGFNMTRYGQQAIVLDTSGTLRAMALDKLKAKFRVVSEFDNNDGTSNLWDYYPVAP